MLRPLFAVFTLVATWWLLRMVRHQRVAPLENLKFLGIGYVFVEAFVADICFTTLLCGCLADGESLLSVSLVLVDLPWFLNSFSGIHFVFLWISSQCFFGSSRYQLEPSSQPLTKGEDSTL